MGSARVQYELERTLPSLQLAAIHGLFSKETELRAITQRRRQFENALVRRHAIARDFHQYIHYEEELEKLRVLRVTRLKEVNKIPRQDMIKMQKEAIAHIVSIFERGVRRLRYDLDLWRYYITWAHRRKMRVVVSRVSARALALFPNKVDLWLLVADHELNDYQGASTSRALLQRGLRLNSISHSRGIQMQALDRPKKKVRRSDHDQTELAKSLAIISAGNKEEDEATLILTEAEKDLIRIWIQYIRMELVFIEKLRRRRMVLGILEDPIEDAIAEDEAAEVAAEEEAGADQVPINNEGEVAPTSIKSMKQGVEPSQSSNALLQGAIPKAALRSAISLESPSSLPPKAHFALLLSMADLVLTFPFYEDREGLRSSLLKDICQTIQARFPTDPNAMLLVSSFPLLDQIQQSVLASSDEIDLREELQDGRLLKEASILSASSSIDEMFEQAQSIARSSIADEREAGYIVYTYLLSLIKNSFEKIKQTSQVVSWIKTIIDSIHDKTLSLVQPSGAHLAIQLRLIRFFQELVESRTIRDALNPYLKACYQRIVNDAKKLHCDDLELERELCKGRLVEVVEASKGKQAKAVKIVERMWRGCERYPSDKVLLLLYAKAIFECFECNILEQEDSRKKWTRVLNHGAGKESALIWNVWLDWIMISQDEKWKIVQLEGAMSKTMSNPEAHEVLLKGYLSADLSHNDLLNRIAYIEKRAYPQSSLWRWMICEIKRWNLSKKERSHLVKRLYTKLMQTSDTKVEDYNAYLRFLVLEQNDPTDGLKVFQEARSRFSIDASKKIILEEEWKTICQSIREQEENEGVEAVEEEEAEDSDTESIYNNNM